MADNSHHRCSYESYTQTSVFGSHDVARMVVDYHIPPMFICTPCLPAEKACTYSRDKLVIFVAYLVNGLRFPLSPFIIDLVNFFGTVLEQYHPNAMKTICGFEARCKMLGFEANLELFRYFYYVRNYDKNYGGWVTMFLFDTKKRCLPRPKDSVDREWKSHYFYVEWADRSWREVFTQRCWVSYVETKKEKIDLDFENAARAEDLILSLDDYPTWGDIMNEELMYEVNNLPLGDLVRITMERNATKRARRAQMATPVVHQLNHQATDMLTDGMGAPNFQDMPFPPHNETPGPAQPASSSVSASEAFIPSWGICKNDSVILSAPSASDFMKNVVPLGDQVYLSRLTQEQFEVDGASHVAAMVAYYQHAIMRAASLERKVTKLQGECQDYDKRMFESMQNNGGLADRNASLEKKLKVSEEKLAKLEAERARWGEIVKGHEQAMLVKNDEIEELNEGMEQMVLGGWECAISYVVKKHPEIMPESFNYDKYTARCLKKSEKAKSRGKKVDEVSSVEDDDGAPPSTVMDTQGV